MKRNTVISILLILFFAACDSQVVEKPKDLIKEKTMISMLVDIHLAEATFNSQAYRDSVVKTMSATDFYYSVLNKYNVSDSLFERSFIYYASEPKVFEKMYRKVTGRLTEMEQEFSGRKNELLEFDEADNPR